MKFLNDEIMLNKVRDELVRLKNELIENGENTMFEQGRISGFETSIQAIDNNLADVASGTVCEIVNKETFSSCNKYTETATNVYIGDEMKQLIMKNAVDGTLVENIDDTIDICLHDNRYGVPVKVIIIKQ